MIDCPDSNYLMRRVSGEYVSALILPGPRRLPPGPLDFCKVLANGQRGGAERSAWLPWLETWIETTGSQDIDATISVQ